ncbi:DUF3108 domain-containing protein [Reyranella sp.]|uniref:DUF3108 domain-containing protein n=1 Tax=Reyranella sp. TaxID=1929291 RepID=UPI002F948DD1
MTFRRALIAFALCSGLSPAALAEEARQVEVGYAITYLAFTGFRIDFTARFNDHRYDVESHTFKEGLIKAVTINYDGKNRAWGGFAAQGARPAGGSLSIVVGDTPRSWIAQYGPGGALKGKSEPPWNPPPDKAIPEDKRNGSLDPLSAAMQVGMAGDAACDRTVASNDGKRRIDVVLTKIGTEPAAAAGVAGARGDLLICSVYTKRVAGDFDDAPKEAESKRERPMKLWFARLDDTSFRYPVKLEAETGFGTIYGKMLFFRERPLTEEEKIAMRR